jgi:hypothetical protein
MSARGAVPTLAAGLVVCVALALAAAPSEGATGGCGQAPAGERYARAVQRALGARRDVWGEALIRSRRGPTYSGVARLLKPLLLAPPAPGSRRADVHYVAFATPARGSRPFAVALHLADGSGVRWRRTGGPMLSVRVGSRNERFGACLGRLATPRLARGYLPILRTSYSDAAGIRYRQESFTTRLRGGAVVSLLSVSTAVPRTAHASGSVRLVGPGGHRAAAYSTARGGTVYAAWLWSRARSLRLDGASYRRARGSLVRYWERRLAGGSLLHVPEPRVMDAQRSLLIQNLSMGWRYSIGNQYEHLAVPESLDSADVLGEYGFLRAERAVLTRTLRRPSSTYPNWSRGRKLLSAARYYRVSGDRRFLRRATPVLARYVDALGRDLARDGSGLLPPERYSSDIPVAVYGLHSQAVAWQGLRSIAAVWAATGQRGLARRAGSLAGRLRSGLLDAVRASARRLPDGSLFVPVRLRAGALPFGTLTSTRLGRYWNLVMPYALASGLFAPRSAEAARILSYVDLHGGRFLGLVRFASRSLSHDPNRPISGSDNVYALNAARFLADNDRPGRLVLSLYGQLAAGMTRGTFVSGEAASIAPHPGTSYRSMYLPPNSTSNASFLETLRLTLVHETTDRKGVPNGLELAFATPRAWLAHGRVIAARAVPTSFGRVSLSIRSARRSVRVRLRIPRRTAPHRLILRLRRPDHRPPASVTLNGRRFGHLSRAGEAIDLSGYAGRLRVLVRYGPQEPPRPVSH